MNTCFDLSGEMTLSLLSAAILIQIPFLIKTCFRAPPKYIILYKKAEEPADKDKSSDESSEEDVLSTEYSDDEYSDDNIEENEEDHEDEPGEGDDELIAEVRNSLISENNHIVREVKGVNNALINALRNIMSDVSENQKTQLKGLLVHLPELISEIREMNEKDINTLNTLITAEGRSLMNVVEKLQQ